MSNLPVQPELRVVEVGDGERLFMLHGGPGASLDYLRPQLDALGDVARLVYYDQCVDGAAGHGPAATGKPVDRAAGKPPTAEDHVADLEALRRRYGEERLSLLGYSWGGLLAMLYAVAHPERVRRLVLLSPAPASATGRAEMRVRMAASQARPEVAALRAELEAQPLDAEARRRARFALAVAGYFFDPRRALELTPFLVRQRVETAVWNSLGDYDLLPALARLDLPALVVHGEDDPIPLATAALTATALRARLVALPRCGHVPYIEAPEATFAAIRAFLAEG